MFRVCKEIQGVQGLQGLQGNQGVQGLSNQGVQGLQGLQGIHSRVAISTEAPSPADVGDFWYDSDDSEPSSITIVIMMNLLING